MIFSEIELNLFDVYVIFLTPPHHVRISPHYLTINDFNSILFCSILFNLIGFMASLSINLAVLNSLPFPSLDGGQLAFVIAEVIAGE